MAEKIRVLVVEDEVLVRLGTAEQLRLEGFDVIEADGADQAIRILEQNSDIHILFTDIDMPGSMDGLRLSAFVRDRWPPVRIVVTSGHKLAGAVVLPEGCVFHTKPYEHSRVVQSFRDLMAR